MARSVTGSLMGDPPPGRTEWAAPAELAAKPAVRRPLTGVTLPEPATRGAQIWDNPLIEVETPTISNDKQGAESGAELSAEIGQLRPVAALDLPDLKPGTPPTAAPTIEWMAPADLLVDASYQRDLSPKSVALIRKIAEGWDWRRFKPPVIAWTERGFEIIDGQHTAIAAATHGGIPKIPVVLVEAVDLQDRASAFVGHNRDRVAVHALQVHHAMVAAGDPEAVTIEQVCTRAGATLLHNQYGTRTYKPGETIAVAAINSLISRRGAQKAREVLQALVQAELAPITANDLKAAELLFTSPDYAAELEPLPLGGEHLANAIRIAAGSWPKEAKELSATKCIPLWKAQAGVWFRKTRKRRTA